MPNPEFDTAQTTSREFPMYATAMAHHWIIWCVHNSDYGCKDCVAKSMCKCYE